MNSSPSKPIPDSPKSPRRGIQFASDNYAGACPEAMDRLIEANQGYAQSYGDDAWTARAADAIRNFFSRECEVFFVFNGTAANSLALASLCESYHSVICHELAHIETDECGGPEFFSNGTKILLGSGQEGKLEPQEVKRLVSRRRDIHYPKPKVVSISQPTELGTLYTLGEVAELSEVIHSLGMALHIDGARFLNYAAIAEVHPGEFVNTSRVDVMSLGGTKAGMTGGEAVVFFDPVLAADFAYRCKQAGQLASKMRFLSAQWVGILESGSWRTHAAHANAMAALLRSLLAPLPTLQFAAATEANAVFLKAQPDLFAALRKRGWLFYEFIGGAARFMCSWKTQEEDVRLLASDFQAILSPYESS